MDNFVVSARKYRPQKFEDVIGQQSIANTLKLAIQNNKLASAYLFCGPRGVGKTTCARIFAKAINCMNPQGNGEACDECESCRSFNEQRSINIQELNAAANNSVEDIRAIIDQVRIPPQLGKYKVIILDEVHMLSGAAGNALLKTLEEPPSYVIFILATTEKHKIMQTIISRCQIFDFNRMEINDIVGNLKMVAEKEGITCDDAALGIIAQKADGGMRDALSIFDQVSNFSQGNITSESVLQCINALDQEYYFKMTDLILEHNVVECMLLYNDIVNKGFNGGVFMAGLASHCRDLMMSLDQATLPLLNVADNLKQRYVEQSKRCTLKFLYFAIRICDRCSNEYRTSYNKRLTVEITLIEAAQFSEDDSVGAGRRPAIRLKPLFKQTVLMQQAVQARREAQQPVASAPQAAATQAAAPVAAPVSQIPQSAPASPAASAAPAAARPIIGLARPSLKDMLNKTRAAMASQGAAFAGVAPAAPGAPAPTAGPSPMPPVPPSIAAAVNPPAANDPDADDDYDSDVIEDVEVTADTDGVIMFADTQLEKQWAMCSKAIEQYDYPMSSRMLAMPIKCLADHKVEVSLHNEMVKKQFDRYVPYIEGMLQQAFKLPDIKLQVKILPAEVVRIITNPVELIAKMRTENPELGRFIDELNLTLA